MPDRSSHPHRRRVSDAAKVADAGKSADRGKSPDPGNDASDARHDESSEQASSAKGHSPHDRKAFHPRVSSKRSKRSDSDDPKDDAVTSTSSSSASKAYGKRSSDSSVSGSKSAGGKASSLKDKIEGKLAGSQGYPHVRSTDDAPSFDDEDSAKVVQVNELAPQIMRRQLYKENPRVYYPNVDSLSRPSHLPQSARLMIAIIIGAGIIVAIICFFLYYDASKFAPEREQEAIIEAISETSELDLPNLLSMVDKTNEEIFDELKDSGDTIYEKVAVGGGPQCELIKLPEGLSVTDAAAMYLAGISKLSALDAIEVLDGSWDLEIDRRNGENISLHYVDFTSGSLQNAIKQAKISENLDRGTEVDSGDDDGFGNAYTTGTVMISGKTYTWTISAIKLTSYYSISGIPDDVSYVGIRIKST